MAYSDSLGNFVQALGESFPEARLDIGSPVASADSAAERVEALCQACAGIRGCERDLVSRDEYVRYVDGLADTLGIEPERNHRLLSDLIPNGVLAGGVGASLLVAAGAAEASDAGVEGVGLLEQGLDLADLGEAACTLGVGWLASRWVRSHYAKKNGAKRQGCERMVERAYLMAMLAEALMSPDGSRKAEAPLRRLRQIGARIPLGGLPQ